ncbi:MAG TPA: hypothetical protein ENK42_00905 [Deltaproteobacteria bacterium]|nr:hypothetical protein [Deltaproteobacteria bacterium]
MKRMVFVLSLLMIFLGWQPVRAIETPIGYPQSIYGMEVAAVYLQPIEMEPEGIMRSRAESDIHLECDIRASENNPNGFAAGEWIPFLTIYYELTKLDTGQKREGKLSPMVANDGPHYGDNVKLFGPGRYRLVYRIEPPADVFGRHTDRQTGVRPWFRPFTMEWEFTYYGVGKKGGY